MYVGRHFGSQGRRLRWRPIGCWYSCSSSAVVLHFGVVKREERYLEAKFGDAYRAYKAQVPRYGVPLSRPASR